MPPYEAAFLFAGSDDCQWRHGYFGICIVGLLPPATGSGWDGHESVKTARAEI
jgi:hypothetical protein